MRRKLEKKEINVETLNAEDIKGAENEWIRDAQATFIRQPDYGKYKNHLGVVRNGGILVCEGWMELSDLSETAKRPVLLP